MNPARLQSIITNMTGSALKVYEAVPIREQWTGQQVYAEMQRQGNRMEFSKVQGCLKDLASQGVVRHFPTDDTFQRVMVNVRPRGASPAPAVDVPAQPEDPIKQLELLAKQLRADAAVLLERADAIDTAVIKIMDTVASAGAASEQLRQLRALLKE